MQQKPRKILLGILVANGDCLLATVIARQIKADDPACHLTWAISNLCRQVIEENPHVDAVWEIPLQNKKEAEKEGWYRFEKEARQKLAAGEFDEFFPVQVYPSNVHHFDGTTRGTIYNAFPRPVTVEARPVLRLTPGEVERVKNFADALGLTRYKNVILFECSSFSGQSFVTPEWAIQVSLELVNRSADLFIIISTHLDLTDIHPRIVSASRLNLRENAQLTHYCSLLLGCSSGITWISTTDWARRLPMVQFIKRGIGFTFASVAYDHRYWKLDDSGIIETTNANTADAVRLIEAVLEQGVAAVKPAFHQRLKPRFRSMLKYSFLFFRKGKFGKAAGVIRNFVSRNY